MTRLFAGTAWDRPARCDRCDKPESECRCPPVVAVPVMVPPEKQTARVSREKRQKGKVVTVVSGLPAEGNDLPALLTRLKTALGTGGALDENQLVVQGDQVERVKSLLQQIGYRVR